MIVLVLLVSWSPCSMKAQDMGLMNTLHALQAQADDALGRLGVLHDPATLSLWDGRSPLPAQQVYAVTDEVRAILATMREPLQHVGMVAQQRLDAAQWPPVADDLGVISRDIEFALSALVSGAEEHERHAGHSVGCEHENERLRDAMETVRDIRDTLAIVSTTLSSFGFTSDR
jgi:hypothetical protein